MTDNQKVILAVLGSVVGHLFLFVWIGVLIAVSNLLPPPQASAASPPQPEEPEEITILLSEFLEEVELTPKELTQRFARTDPDQESAVKPENAPFHAERNTLAAADQPPDPDSDLPTPTVKARDDVPFFEIRDREFVDGEFNDASAASDPSDPSPPSPTSPSENRNMLQPPRVPEQSDGEAEEKPDTPSEEPLENRADPADQPKKAPDADPDQPAEADEIPETSAEMLVQPDSRNPEEARLAESRERFENPRAATALPLPNPAEKDQDAAAIRRAEEIGAPAEPETPRPASAMPKLKQYIPTPPDPMAAQNPPSPPQPASAHIPPSPKPPSDAPAFTPETAARSVSGTISNRSDTPALDVEATDLGRYKKAVNQAIERQWHRYREKNGDFVTYGSLRVTFRVGNDGRVRNLKLVKNEANAIMAEFTLRAILDAKIPDMPPSVAAQIGNSLDFTYNMIIY